MPKIGNVRLGPHISPYGLPCTILWRLRRVGALLRGFHETIYRWCRLKRIATRVESSVSRWRILVTAKHAMSMRLKHAVYFRHAQWQGDFHSENEFYRLLDQERKRKGRSKKQCVIMLVDVTAFDEGQKRGCVVDRIVSALRTSTREIDPKGWYRHSEVIGILFTEIADTSDPGLEGVVARIRRLLSSILDDSRMQRLTISCRIISGEVETRKPANH